MKLLTALFLLIAVSVFGAVPSYTVFRGTGGILITSNPPTGNITIDGSGIFTSSGTNATLSIATNGVPVLNNATQANFIMGTNVVLTATNIGSVAHIGIHAVGGQSSSMILSNLIGTVGRNVTNVISLSTSNATSKPITNAYAAGVLTVFGFEAGTNVILSMNASNIVISASGAGGGSTVAPPISSVQFNSNGVQQGSANFTFTNGQVYINNPGAVGSAQLTLANTTQSVEWDLAIGSNPETYHFGIRNGATYAMVWELAGNVGIGTTNPGSRLDVVGRIGISPGPSLFATNALDVSGHASIRSNLFLANLPTNGSPIAFLATDAAGVVYETAVPSGGGGATPAPPISSVQFNSNGVMQGSDSVIITNSNLEITEGIVGRNVGGGRLFASNRTTVMMQWNDTIAYKEGNYWFPNLYMADGGNSATTNTDKTGYGNMLFGGGAGVSLSSGVENLFMGHLAGGLITLGSHNIGLAHGAGYGITTGSNNNIVGFQAGHSLAGGRDNNIMGSQTGVLLTNVDYNNIIGSTTLPVANGAGNAILGSFVGQLSTSMWYNVLLGYSAASRQPALTNVLWVDTISRASASAELTNALIRGQMAASMANQTLLVNAGRMNLNGSTTVGGTIAPVQVLHVTGALNPKLRLDYNSGLSDYYANFGHDGSTGGDGNSLGGLQITAQGPTANSTSLRIKFANKYAANGADLRMIIETNGFVGIGTNAPLVMLDVVGGIRSHTVTASRIAAFHTDKTLTNGATTVALLDNFFAMGITNIVAADAGIVIRTNNGALTISNTVAAAGGTTPPGNSNQIPFLNVAGTAYMYAGYSSITNPGFGFSPSGPQGGYGGLMVFSDVSHGLVTIGHPNPASDLATFTTAFAVSNRYNGTGFKQEMSKYDAVDVGSGSDPISTFVTYRTWSGTTPTIAAEIRKDGMGFFSHGTMYPSNSLASTMPTAAELGPGGYWVGNSNASLVTVYSLNGSSTAMKVLAP